MEESFITNCKERSEKYNASRQAERLVDDNINSRCWQAKGVIPKVVSEELYRHECTIYTKPTAKTRQQKKVLEVKGSPVVNKVR
ncbi:hypothetical protein Trydic_g9688 [Trypoxylus dichotomus]